MAEKRVKRRLAAITAADVVGYSRLMGEDEAGTLAQLKVLRKELLDPKIAEYGGRIFKTTGDGFLIEFPSAVDAVQHAADVQRAMVQRNAAIPEDRRMELRIGINIGDIIVEGDDLFGDGVNVAARLEGLAEPGGTCVSGTVFDQVKDKLELGFDDLGTQEVKNIAEPVRVYQVRSATGRTSSSPSLSVSQQKVQFCSAPDGVRIGYATIGQGPPLVRTATWLTHLELDWQVQTRHKLIEALARDHTLIRYDQRGNGLSDWDVEDISFNAFVSDLEAVVGELGLDSFALYGQSQGAAVALAYAARHPNKVTHLVLLGGFARGRRTRGSEGQIAESEAFLTLIREGWGKDNPIILQMFGSIFMPDANADQLSGLTYLQKTTTTPENAARIRFANDEIDISSELEKITVPTLVLHARLDAMVPIEEGLRIAAAVPDARFVQLESRNHSLLPNEPAWQRFLDEVSAFLAG